MRSFFLSRVEKVSIDLSFDSSSHLVCSCCYAANPVFAGTCVLGLFFVVARGLLVNPAERERAMVNMSPWKGVGFALRDVCL